MDNILPIKLRPIIAMLISKGQQPYGDGTVTHLDHALQCATLAESNGASPEMITACLLHDLGCLIDSGELHEYRAMGILKTLFAEAVTEPIRLHVEAKRYLAQVDSNYYQSLSQSALRDFQPTDILSPEAAQVFINKPYATEAVQLRRWDEQAQVSGAVTPQLSHFFPVLVACLV